MLPHWSSGKESACQAGDPGLNPGSGRSPAEGKDNPVWYSCLRNPMDRGALWGCKRVGQDLATKQQHLPLCPVPPWEQGGPCPVCPQEGAGGQVWLCLAHLGSGVLSWLILARSPEDNHSSFSGGASLFSGQSMVIVLPKEEVMGRHFL